MANYKRGRGRLKDSARKTTYSWTVRSRLRWQRIQRDRVRDEVADVMVKVDSSMINALGYDDATRTLTVEFSDGAQYVYAKVPRTVYDRLIASTSTGGAFVELVKSKGYAYKKVVGGNGK